MVCVHIIFNSIILTLLLDLTSENKELIMPVFFCVFFILFLVTSAYDGVDDKLSDVENSWPSLFISMSELELVEYWKQCNVHIWENIYLKKMTRKIKYSHFIRDQCYTRQSRHHTLYF